MRRSVPFATALLLASTLAASAQAQSQTIRVLMGSHLPAATGKSTAYFASCGAVNYAVKVSRETKTVTLTRSNGPDIDLSATTVGERLLACEAVR